jgi:hypothetical protein
MRKHYDFSKGTRGNPYAARLRRSRDQGESDEEPPLTQSQITELERRIRDSDDRTRYFLASFMTPRFILYYNVSEDNYGMNDPDYATLFKRRPAAAAIQSLIGTRIKIVRCRVNRRGRLVLSSLPSPFPKRRQRRRGAG